MLGFCLGGSLLTAGCGSDGGAPPTVKVHGQVTCDGQPLTQGTVSFLPVDKTLRPATGELDAQGRYELSSFRAADGAMPGEYKVVVVSLKSGPTLENPSQPEVSNIAAIYTKADTTTLSASVPSDVKGCRTELHGDVEITSDAEPFRPQKIDDVQQARGVHGVQQVVRQHTPTAR